MAKAAPNLQIFETGRQRCGFPNRLVEEFSSFAALPYHPRKARLQTMADHGMNHEQRAARLTRWCASLRVCSACQPTVSMIGSDQVFFAADTGVGEG